jgi:hypothetical protein
MSQEVSGETLFRSDITLGAGLNVGSTLSLGTAKGELDLSAWRPTTLIKRHGS